MRHPERARSARRVSRSFAQARETSGAKPQGVADAGSINDYGWLFVGKVTFSSVSQQKSLRDPFLARPPVVLVGLPRSAKPHLSKLRCGSASLTQDDAPTFMYHKTESGYTFEICTTQPPSSGGADYSVQRMTSHGFPTFSAYLITDNVPFELPSQNTTTRSA